MRNQKVGADPVKQFKPANKGKTVTQSQKQPGKRFETGSGVKALEKMFGAKSRKEAQV